MTAAYEPRSKSSTAPANPSGLGARIGVIVMRAVPAWNAMFIEPWIIGASIVALLVRKVRHQQQVLVSKPVSANRPLITAASGIMILCLAIVVLLRITHESGKTYSDEVAWVGAILMLASLLLARARRQPQPQRAALADFAFAGGTAALLASILFAIFQL